MNSLALTVLKIRVFEVSGNVVEETIFKKVAYSTPYLSGANKSLKDICKMDVNSFSFIATKFIEVLIRPYFHYKS